MKHIHPALLSTFVKRLLFLSVLFSAAQLTQAQCLTPYPKGDIDSTLRNVPRSTVVTRNDVSSFGSGSSLVSDSLAIVTPPQHGTAVVVNDSTILYTPAPGFVGTDLYIYRTCNACGSCALASVTIEVRSYCPAPVAANDYYTVYNNVPNTLNVTTNDLNVAGGKLTVSILAQPKHGIASVLSSTSADQVRYTGNTGYIGADTLAYIVCDTCPGSKCDTAYVFLDVTTCLPLSAANDTMVVQQLGTVSGNIVSNDINAIGFGTISVSLLNGSHFGSTVSLTGSTISYTAGGSRFGIDTIAYQICSNCGCDTAFAFFNVTPKPCSKPTAVADNVYSGYYPNCTNSFSVLTNDVLPINSGTPVISIVTGPRYGTASVLGTKVQYTCTDSSKKGQTDTLYYSLCNGCFCDTAMVVINITNYPCNGLNPVINNDSIHVCRNYGVTIPVGANDYDPEGGVITIGTITQGAHGTAIAAGSGFIAYTPVTDFSGHDVFTYQACDNGTPVLCSTATVDVYVDACNHAPVIVNMARQATDTLHVYVVEDSTLQYCFQYIQLDSPQVRIASISPSIDTITPTAGSTSLGANPCVNITPPVGSTTEQTVQVVICNKYPLCDTVSVIISIIPRDHAPVANNDLLNYTWSGCAPINVLKNDMDLDMGDHLTITAFDSTTAHGTVVKTGDSTLCYTPDNTYAGTDTIHYTICDGTGLCSSAVVVVRVPVQARNDAGTTLQDQPIAIPVTNNDTRGSAQYIALCSTPLHGAAVIDSNNVVRYTPDHDYPYNPLNQDTMGAGKDSFCYTLCNVSGTDTSCSSAMVYITITPKGKFYIPQGISPDGDGINDKFVIVSADEFPKSQLLVYNRWGDEVWRNDGDGYQNDFDGTWKKSGQPLPDGSYWYIFKFNDNIHGDTMGYVVIQR